MTQYFQFELEKTIGAVELNAQLHNAGGSQPISKGVLDADRDRMTRGAGSVVKDTDLANQFLLFNVGEGLTEPSRIEPKLEGSDESPDVLVGVSLEAFNLPPSEGEVKGSATVRFTMGKDPSSTDRYFETAFWCIAAGLELYDEAKGGHKRKSQPKELQSDFQKAFGNRPIEIPGGLAVMSFEVVRHPPEPWWKKIFNFLESSTGKSLTATLGFPAITNSAIQMIDELFSRFVSEPEVLFKSRPLTLALSKYAKDMYTGGTKSIALGALNPGWSLLARGKDYARLTGEGNKIRFYPMYGVIAPEGLPVETLIAKPSENPYSEVGYALLRVGMKPTRLDPKFNFG